MNARAVKGVGFKHQCYGFVGSNPTSCKALIAQLVEHGSYEPKAVGSSPTKSTCLYGVMEIILVYGTNDPGSIPGRDLVGVWL